MRVSFIESHPVTPEEPPGLLLYGGDIGWQVARQREALAHPHDEDGLSSILPDPVEVIAGREFGSAESRAHVFVGFSEVSATDLDELDRWIRTLLPGIGSFGWDESEEDQDVARTLVGEDDRRSLFLGGEGFGVRADIIRTVRPIWIAAPESALGQQLHLQPLVILTCGGFVAVAAHRVDVPSIDRSEGLDRPPSERGTISSGPDPRGSAGFLADVLLSLLGDFESAIRAGSRALNSWETEFFEEIAARRGSGESELRFDKLREIQTAATALEEALIRLQQEELTPVTMPLENFNERSGAARLQGSVAAARGLRDSFRDGLALASSVLTTEQLHLARVADERSGRLQEGITRLTAFLLVPALIGTIFGANVWLPGSTPAARFGWMVGIMVISAVATYVLIRVFERTGTSG